MKTLNFKSVKSTLPTARLMWVLIATILMTWSVKIEAQGVTYSVVFWDNYSPNQSVANCQSDSIKCVFPNGATNIVWITVPMVAKVYHGDTLVLLSGFNGGVTCSYSGGGKGLFLRPTTAPISAGFPTTDTICGTEQKLLDLGNYSLYGFSTYNWWKNGVLQSQHTQTISADAGLWVGQVINICGTMSDSIHIINYTPNPPVLNNISVCQGASAPLDPGTGFDSYHWNTGSLDTILYPTTTGVYSVTVTDNGCTSTASATVTFNTTQVPAIENVSTQIDPFQPDYGNNIVVWDSLAYTGLSSINVYVDGIFDGSTPYQNGRMTLSISSVQSGHLIRIAGVGTCGESSLSLYVKSNHAYASQGVPQGVNVGWDGLEFQGKDSLVSEYHIWKEDSNHVLTMVGTVGGLFHSYTDVSGGGLIYIVGAIVSAKGIQTEYLSNIVDNNVGIQTHDKIDFSIYPNPASNVIHITSSENLTTFIYDINGNLVRSSTDKDINIEDVPSGEYCMKVINATTGISGYKPFIITH